MTMIEIKHLIWLLRKNLDANTYKHCKDQFDALADDIVLEEKDMYFAQHPEEMLHG